VVTADGEALSVNSYQHPDLFWALRGGGGCTFAIITSVVYKTYRTLPMTGVSISATQLSQNAAGNMMTKLVGMLGNLSDMGWSGYGGLTTNLFRFTLLAQNITSPEDTNKTLDTLIEFFRQTAGGRPVEVSSSSFPSFYDWFLSPFNTDGDIPEGVDREIISRFIYRDMAKENPDKVADIMSALSVPGIFIK
jgi:hypothetical protein